MRAISGLGQEGTLERTDEETVCIGTTKLSLSREVRRDELPFSFNPRTSDTEFGIISAARPGLVTDFCLVYVILSRRGEHQELWVPSPLYR